MLVITLKIGYGHRLDAERPRLSLAFGEKIVERKQIEPITFDRVPRFFGAFEVAQVAF
jgi:hypothetical protein